MTGTKMGAADLRHANSARKAGRVTWRLAPGDWIVRKHLHDAYGGQRQGGIATPAGADHIFIFTDPKTGEQHGYFDEWVGDELHYCGEGQPQHGDQRMAGGNKAILHHEQAGKTIRAFYGSKGTVRYVGEFALARDGDPAGTTST